MAAGLAPCRSPCSSARPVSPPAPARQLAVSGSDSAASSATSCSIVSSARSAPSVYPIVTGGIALVLPDRRHRDHLARDLAGPARRRAGALQLRPRQPAAASPTSRAGRTRSISVLVRRPARRAAGLRLGAGSAGSAACWRRLSWRSPRARLTAARPTSSDQRSATPVHGELDLRRRRRSRADARPPSAAAPPRTVQSRPSAPTAAGARARERWRAGARLTTSSCRRSSSSPSPASAATSASTGPPSPRPRRRSSGCSTISACAARSSTSGPGPVVTLYELEPAPGHARRARDRARRRHRPLAVRHVGAGRGGAGPQRDRHRAARTSSARPCYLRDLLSSAAYEDTSVRLTLALGKDISGEPVVVDLARMPHLLIAGTTGSGKSVAINAMILSLLYRLPAGPVQVHHDRSQGDRAVGLRGHPAPAQPGGDRAAQGDRRAQVGGPRDGRALPADVAAGRARRLRLQPQDQRGDRAGRAAVAAGADRLRAGHRRPGVRGAVDRDGPAAADRGRRRRGRRSDADRGQGDRSRRSSACRRRRAPPASI